MNFMGAGGAVVIDLNGCSSLCPVSGSNGCMVQTNMPENACHMTIHVCWGCMCQCKKEAGFLAAGQEE